MTQSQCSNGHAWDKLYGGICNLCGGKNVITHEDIEQSAVPPEVIPATAPEATEAPASQE